MAKKGTKRPNKNDILGSRFSAYISMNSPCYDKNFVNIIKQIRPDWFITQFDKANIQREKILELAKNGKEKPKMTTALGCALYQYMLRDKNFVNIIKQIRPDWFFTKDDIWNEKYNELKEFININNRYPTYASKDKKEIKILYWISNQRAAKKGQMRNNLTRERIKLLESLPNWQWELDLDKIWNIKYNELKQFIKVNSRFPTQNKKENKLYTWINTQRSMKKKNKLIRQRIKLLEQLFNWRWELDLNEKWFNKYNELKKFIKTNKKYPSKESKDIIEKSLGLWISTQRKSKKGFGRGKMTLERIKLLEELPNWKWDGKFFS